MKRLALDAALVAIALYLSGCGTAFGAAVRDATIAVVKQCTCQHQHDDEGEHD